MVIEPFNGGGCAFSPNDYRNADDEERDFEEQSSEAMDMWRCQFWKENGRPPSGEEENEHFESLKRARETAQSLEWAGDDGDCPF